VLFVILTQGGRKAKRVDSSSDHAHRFDSFSSVDGTRFEMILHQGFRFASIGGLRRENTDNQVRAMLTTELEFCWQTLAWESIKIAPLTSKAPFEDRFAFKEVAY
jgi:hypothetical protein